jgi:hypothetical protein
MLGEKPTHSTFDVCQHLIGHHAGAGETTGAAQYQQETTTQNVDEKEGAGKEWSSDMQIREYCY